MSKEPVLFNDWVNGFIPFGDGGKYVKVSILLPAVEKSA